MDLVRRLVGRWQALDELREGGPEFHEFHARESLKTGRDLQLGLLHLGDLLAFAPDRVEALELLRAYAGRLDLQDALSFGKPAAEAVRAWDLHRRGRVREALEVLLAVVKAAPDKDYLGAWGLGWLEAGFEQVPGELVKAWLGQAMRALPESSRCVRRRVGVAWRTAQIALRWKERGGADPPLVLGLLRKAGRFDEGLPLARATAALKADSPAWTQLGILLREMGDLAGAREAFDRALGCDPEDPFPLFESAALHLERGDWASAYGIFQRVLAQHPRNEQALAGLAWCGYRQNDFDEKALAVLIGLSEAGNRHAREWVHQARPYAGFLPSPQEESSRVLRHLAGLRESPDRTVELPLEEVESPSNLLAFRLAWPLGSVEVRYGCVGRPDPRLPVEPTAWQLWKRRGETLEPALPRPPREVWEPVAELAGQPFESTRAWARASFLGAELGPRSAGALLACAVNPPPPPRGVHAFDWTVAMQFAALQTLAFVDEGWAEGARRGALFSVLLGPRDWTTEMAAVVLSRLVREEPLRVSDVHRAFDRLDRARPQPGTPYYEPGVLASWARLPGLTAAESRPLKARLK